MADIIIQSGNAGELSPLLDGRSDLEKYYSGCRILKNMIPLPYGPVERRPGTYFVTECKESTKKARLQSFQYSTEQAYIIEFGEEYCRFYREHGQILGGEGTYDLSALDNIVAHWLLDDNDASTTVLDDDGNTHDGTASVSTDVLHVEGKVGTGCFNLNGQYDITISDHNDFSFTNSFDDSPFSILCWAYVTEQGGLQVLMSKWRDSSAIQEWRFSLSANRKLQLHLASSVVLSSSMVAQWYLNDDAANTHVDDVSTNHDGVCSVNTNTISTTGIINDCFDFGGSVSIEIADHAELSFGDGINDSPFSISAWIYVERLGVTQEIISKSDYTTAAEAREWSFFVSTNNRLVFSIWDESSNAYQQVYTNNSLTTGWHHVVSTYDGSGGSTAYNGQNLYLDGSKVTDVTRWGNQSYVAMENTAAKVYISAIINPSGALDGFFGNKIDNVIIFDDELNTGEVNTLYNSGSGIEILTDASLQIYSISDNAVSTGWHQLAATYSAPADETAAADGIILYVDGVAVSSTAVNDANYTAMQNRAEEVRIGSQRNSADSANEKFWGDKIDEVSIFSDVLTPAEIAALYTEVAYEIETDYLEDDLFGLQHSQSADVLFNVHGNYPPSKLIRQEHNLWEIEDIVFDWPPFMEENDTDTTIAASARIGIVDLTASSSIFTEDMIGAYFLIRHPRTDNSEEKELTTDYSGYADTGVTGIVVDVEGGWRCRTSDTWTGTVKLERSYDGELILVLDAAPAGGAWSAGDIITGATSGETCKIVSVNDSTHYYIKHLTGSFTDGEVLSNQSANSRDCAATYPRYEGWSTLETFQSTSDQNFNLTGTETLGNAYLRAQRTVDSAGLDPVVTVSVERFYYYGIVKITGYTSSTSVTADVIRPLGSTDATKLWSEGMWSDERGYPRTTAFYEGRQWFAGTDYLPLDIAGSVTNQYNNMKTGQLDDDSVKFTLDSAQQNMIRWLVGHETLVIGTSGAEWRLGSTDPSQAITPTNPMRPRIQTTYGSKELQALLLANAVLFVDAQGEKVRGAQYIYEQGETGGYDAPDYTMLSEHITASGIVDMAFQQNPYPILWCVLDNGNLVGMMFEPGQKVWGWFRCEIDGLVESVAIIRGDSEDEIWIIVKRTIDGTDKRYIEYFKPRDWGDDQADCFFVDSGLTWDGGDAVDITDVSIADPCVVTAANTFSDGDQIKIVDVEGTVEINNKVYTVLNATSTNFQLQDVAGSVTIDSSGWTAYTSGGTAQQVENSFSGLDHLEGETVSVLGDGSVHADVVVSSGAVTLTDYYNKVHIGLGYTSAYQPMELAVAGANIRGKNKRIHQIIFSFYKTLGAKFGPTSGDETIPFRKTTDPLGEPPPLFTGKKVQTFNGGYELEGDIYVEQTQPLPLTVRSITVKTGIYD